MTTKIHKHCEKYVTSLRRMAVSILRRNYERHSIMVTSMRMRGMRNHGCSGEEQAGVLTHKESKDGSDRRSWWVQVLMRAPIDCGQYRHLQKEKGLG